MCMKYTHTHTHLPTFSVLGIPHPNCQHLVQASRDMCLASSSEFSGLFIFSWLYIQPEIKIFRVGECVCLPSPQ